MTKSEKILLEIVAKAIDKNYCLNPDDLQKVNWVEVMDVATAQGVLGIAFDAIEMLPADCPPDMDTLMDWLGQISYIEQINEQYNKTVGEIANIYADNSIRTIVLKGLASASWYPKIGA